MKKNVFLAKGLDQAQSTISLPGYFVVAPSVIYGINYYPKWAESQGGPWPNPLIYATITPHKIINSDKGRT